MERLARRHRQLPGRPRAGRPHPGGDAVHAADPSPVPITPRTQAEVTRFFDGLDLMPPGVVPVSEWDLGDAMDTTIGGLVGYVGIGRKP